MNMKKENYHKFLYIVSILLLVGFSIRLIADYCTYNQYSSAPFYLYIVVRTIEFIIPSIIIFIVAQVLKKKYNKV